MKKIVRYRFIENKILTLLQYIKDFFPELLYFPVDILQIIQSIENYRVWSYQYYAKKLNVSLDDVINCCQSFSGCTFKSNENEQYLITFNKSMVQGRQNWTLAHELGHCQVNHFENIHQQQLSDNNIAFNTIEHCIEQEADYFAATILAPFPLFKYFNITSSLDVEKIFGLSTQASINRYKEYIVWQKSHCKTAIDNDIVRIYSHLLNK